MTEATFQSGFQRKSAMPFVVGAVLTSLVAHGLLLLYLEFRKVPPPKPYQKPVELVMIDVPKPPPPPEPPPEEEKPPEPPKVKLKPPPVKVAKVAPPPEPPPENLPPPPNEPAPEPTKPVMIIAGINMASTTSAGSFAAPVGNTAYGKSDNKAVAPDEVKPYAAPKYAPVYAVDSEPEVLSEADREYPTEARLAGVEGSVLLSIDISAEGLVTSAKVINGPGYGLNEAALAALRRFKFRPAKKGGEAVATTIQYTYTFLLD